jgi:hypothetical protein
VGASTVKWTTPHPCLVLSESESSLCTNFKFCEEKNHTHFMMYKAKQFMMTKKNSKKSLHILEDTASGMQVGDTEQVVV